MAYADTIEALKKALSGYSEEEDKMKALYDTARNNAVDEYDEAKRNLELTYADDRNRASSDVMREEKNYSQMLASRGLGSSGEASQAKLNSGVNLSSTLSALAKAKNESLGELSSELRSTKQKLDLDEAENRQTLLDNKLSTEVSLADTEAEKENAEKELAALTAAEKASSGSGSGSGSGDSGSGSGDSGDGEDGKNENYIPSISAKELAKQIVSSSTKGDLSVSDDAERYLVEQYLLDMQNSYDIDPGYWKDLIFCLRGYGYEDDPQITKEIRVITFAAKSYYETQYDKLYKIYLEAGKGADKARALSKSIARDLEMTYAYTHSGDLTEFRNCCTVLGFTKGEVARYLALAESRNNNGGSFILGSFK